MLEVPMYNRQGKVKAFFLVDDIDSWVTQYRWSLIGKGYVARKEKGKSIQLHRELFNPEDIEGKVVDHINGNPLDNRRQNLRVCTVGENNRNNRGRSQGTSGVTGVSCYNNKWKARIKINRKDIHLGVFDNKEDAIKARKEAEVKYFGEFRRKD